MPSQANLTYEGGRETIPERAQFSPGGKKKKEKKKAGREGGLIQCKADLKIPMLTLFYYPPTLPSN